PPLHPAGLDSRSHLPAAGVRGDLHDHAGRAGQRHDQPAVLPVHQGVPRLRDRAGGGARRRGGCRDHPRRDPEPAHLLPPARRLEGGMTVSTTLAPRTRRRPLRQRINGGLLSLLAWVAGIAFFFPVGWMVLSSFKTEGDAYTNPPKFVFEPTLEQYISIFQRGIE